MNTDTAPNALIFDSALELLLTLGLLTLGILLLSVLAYRAGQMSQRRWRAVLTSMPVGIALIDAQRQQIMFTNAAATSVIPMLDMTAIIQRAATHPHPLAWTVTGAEETVIHLQTHRSDPAGRTIVLTLQDRSQHQHHEQQHRGFLQALSHELQTPLTAIQGHLAYIMAQTQTAQEHVWRGSLQVVHDEITRLAWLTPNVLTLLKLDAQHALNRRPHHLGLIVEEVVQHLWEHAHARSISLQVAVDPGLERISLDRSAWKQVFLNLLDNGIKYGRAGGTIVVTVQQTATVQIVQVHDDGPGIAAADLPHVFTRLYRTEGQQHIPGSGLGLTIVQAIVEHHGGQIVCHSPSELGQGTSFQITLPRGYKDVTEA